jgi:hypothetical protein
MFVVDGICGLVSEYADELAPDNIPRAIVRLRPNIRNRTQSVDFDVPLCDAVGVPYTLTDSLVHHYESDSRPWHESTFNMSDCVFFTDDPCESPNLTDHTRWSTSFPVNPSTLSVSLFTPALGSSPHMVPGRLNSFNQWVSSIEYDLDVNVRYVTLFVGRDKSSE